VSAPNPSAKNLHVNAEPPTEIPLEDRQLTPEETESLLRGFEPEAPEPVNNGDDPDQAQQAGDFFSTMPKPQTQQEPGQRAPEPQQQQPEHQMAPPFAQQQPKQPPQQQPAQQPQTDPQLQALQAQNQMLQQQIQLMQQQMTQLQQAPPQAQQPGQQQQPQQTQFDFNVPDQYLSALRSEDNNVVRSALNGLLNGVANSVAQQMRTEYESKLTQVQPQMDQRFQTYTKAQEVNQDMFGTYPELKPFREFVKTAATQIAGNLGIDAWNADVRDAIAERLAPMVPGLGQKIQQIRAQRMGQMQAQMPAAPQQQYLPQGQGYAPAPQQMHPLQQAAQQPVQGVHGGPVYVRDAAGNLVPYQPQQQFVAGQHARPAGQQVDPRLQDIWSTLGY